MDLSGKETFYPIIILFCYLTTCLCIKCYQCENEQSNHMCTSDRQLLECEEGMDTCQTIVSYSDVSEKLAIIKTCTKNVSCDLQINATMYDTPCDQSESSWICTSCCHHDGCNINGASHLIFYQTLSLSMILLLVVGQFVLLNYEFSVT